MKLLFTFLFITTFSSFAQLTGTTGNDVAICEGTTGDYITFIGLNGTAPYTFEYNLNGGNSEFITTISGGSVSFSGSSLAPGNNIYQLIQITDALGNTAVLTDYVTVSVSAIPFVNAGIDQSVCPGTSVTLSATGASFYTWNNGIENGVSFIPNSTMTYTVNGVSADGCMNTDQVTVFVECANLIEKVTAEVLLYPNPSESFVNIESEQNIQSFEIIDLNGRMITSNQKVDSKKLNLDFSAYQKGIYLVQLTIGNQQIVKRISIQ